MDWQNILWLVGIVVLAIVMMRFGCGAMCGMKTEPRQKKEQNEERPRSPSTRQ